MPLIFVGGGQRVEMEKPTLFSPALASSHIVRSLENMPWIPHLRSSYPGKGPVNLDQLGA